MYFRTAKQLYDSKQFKTLRQILIDEQLQKCGEIYCAKCGRIIANTYEIICHHKIPLTSENLNKPEIALNQNNLELICFNPCHNREHCRFGYENERTVYLVTGSPLSGKSTFVKNNSGKDDIIVDLDTIWQCFSVNPRYIKPDTLKGFVFNVYNAAIDNVMMRTGKWNNAWVIGSFPRVMDRNRMIEKLGAEEIHIDTPKEVCLQRLNQDKSRETIKKEYMKYIETYWRDYQESELLE